MTIGGRQSVKWDAVPGAVSYDIELLNAAAGVLLNTLSRNEPEVSAALLLAGQGPGNYNIRVRARDEVGPGAWSGLLPIEYAFLPAPGNLRVE